ncbi:hypothetical protein H2201_004164 [Coniosporium apollinis]|uniref:MYND-type zinc finger protein samB n=1 Tax=Coniosporium apollinis TaxID=61459 RepID=A0ABQ9NWG5_9PEZI|nr:hypothetical protein H2201_004164 [Coniosporium apollinis]
MREVNFSIPNANKASVGITTALYDRRALDCTSTLPLINSLNHLAYLTTSSARIRDILTVDGGVERLVCILKEGRSKDMMDMWKWNLAFQCVVNIGVRGSENVRTRVVEADMVPVIATILDNYLKVIEKCREKAEAETKRNSRSLGTSGRHYPRVSEQLGLSSGHRHERHRRQAPPPIEIPQPPSHAPTDSQIVDAPPVPPTFPFSSPPERTSFSRHHHHHHHRSHESRRYETLPSSSRQNLPQPLASAGPVLEPPEPFGIRPVRDADRLPSMLPMAAGEITSQPESPTTPNALINVPPTSPRVVASGGRTRRRPSIRHQLSMSGDSDGGQDEELLASEDSAAAGDAVEPIVGLQNEINMQDIVDNEEMLDAGATPVGLNAAPSEDTDAETFNITHRSAIDGSLINPAVNQAAGPMAFSPAQPTINVVNATPQTMQANWYPRYMQDRTITAGVLAAMPRDEDVLMSLQLLAYVSKYCNLRSYFQESHLVPKLKIGADLAMLDGEAPAKPAVTEEDEDEEYLLPDDFNIFPLVEKFTVRHHSQDMQYWAGVVMRNLCRKDDSRGGIRQCAYYECGRWEEFTRQFAKCRRCRRTKYCSKECQKSAWVYHRHWCVAAQQ